MKFVGAHLPARELSPDRRPTTAATLTFLTVHIVWAAGKEVQVRMSGSRAVHVKRAGGHLEKLGTTATRPAEK